MDFFLIMIPELLRFIDDRGSLCPSNAVEWANFLHQERGEDSRAHPCIVPVAFGCLAGVILLYFEQFLRNEMMPKLKGVNQIAPEKTTDELLSVDAWSGFEDEILNKVEKKLCDWGSTYGVSKNDAGIRIHFFIHEYKKSDCTMLFHEKLLPAGREVFLYEENFRKYTDISEHVAIWLCSPIQISLHALLDGFFNNVLEQILENEAKGWDNLNLEGK